MQPVVRTALQNALLTDVILTRASRQGAAKLMLMVCVCTSVMLTGCDKKAIDSNATDTDKTAVTDPVMAAPVSATTLDTEVTAEASAKAKTQSNTEATGDSAITATTTIPKTTIPKMPMTPMTPKTPKTPMTPKTPTTTTAMPLAEVTAKNMKTAVILPLTYSSQLSDTQKKCLKEVDEATFARKAEAYYRQHFSQTELAELNGFYESTTGRVFSEYGLQQILLSTGVPTDESAIVPPSTAQIEEITRLRERPTFKKYEQLNLATGADSLMGALNPSINTALHDCHVDLDI